jgi:N6-adenosine-specific RNA methylase IME4
MSGYRTIVADPPWHYGREWNGFSSGKDTLQGGKSAEGTTALPYATLSLEAVKALPVRALAAPEAHLYLWTTQRFLWDARDVLRAWGFSDGIVLTWCKKPMGAGLGDSFAPTTEFVLFAHRGGLRPSARHDSTWFAGPRANHSQKPDVLLDIVEKVSPGPYLEMFARRARFGWDYWGDQSLGTAEVPDAA